MTYGRRAFDIETGRQSHLDVSISSGRASARVITIGEQPRVLASRRTHFIRAAEALLVRKVEVLFECRQLCFS